MPKHMTQVPILINQDKDGGVTKNPQSMIENERKTTWWRTAFDTVFPESMHEPIREDMRWYDYTEHMPDATEQKKVFGFNSYPPSAGENLD